MNTFENPFSRYETIGVALVGTGGNGSKLATGLKSLALALRETKDIELQVALIDPDTVEKPNLARQNFWPADLGHNKAVALATRINLGSGLSWEAIPRELESQDLIGTQIIITATDNRSSRALVAQNTNYSQLWLDLGNNARDGQVVLGGYGLPTSAELWPELVDPSKEEADAPSCSTLEALFKQDLYVNDFAAIWGLQILWDLLFRNEISYHGVVYDLERGEATPIPIPAGSATTATRSSAVG